MGWGGGGEGGRIRVYRTMKEMYKRCFTCSEFAGFMNEVSLKQSEKRSREVESVCYRNKMIER